MEWLSFLHLNSIVSPDVPSLKIIIITARCIKTSQFIWQIGLKNQAFLAMPHCFDCTCFKIAKIQSA